MVTDSTFITRIVLKNYKSIAACDVQLGPLTFLLGPNGAGKSNFLDALHFVGDGLVHSLDYAVRQRGGIKNLFHHLASRSNELSVHVELAVSPQVQGAYSFRLGLVKEDVMSWRWEVLEEECRVGADFFHLKNGKVQSSVGTVPSPAQDRLYLVRASGVTPFREVLDVLSDMHFYHLDPRTIPDIDTYDPQQRLRPDGSNLASVLAVLNYADPDAKTRIGEFLRIVLPTLRKVSVEPVIVERQNQEAATSPNNLEASRIALVFQQIVGRSVALFGPPQMSQGTMRTLAILTALYQVGVHKRRPTLTAIDDVEAAIFPGALRVILDALQEASLTTQVLVATQSPELLDEKDVAAESILAVAADDGVTRIGPLADADRAVVRDRLFTVGQLLRATRLEPAGNGADQSNAAPPHLLEEAGA